MSRLKQWDTMPDEDGYYWCEKVYLQFSSRSYDPPRPEEGEELDETIMLVDDYMRDTVLDSCGTWYGPLVPPWEETQ